jgi:hypothetical protein
MFIIIQSTQFWYKHIMRLNVRKPCPVHNMALTYLLTEPSPS